MSKTVDERVVEMRFDNKQFEANVKTSMSTLDKLKNSLKLSDASKGLENVSNAAKKCNISGIGTAVETIQSKFSSFEVMAITALANITNSAVNCGKRMVSALTIDPVKTGFNEYETKINAIQTIMSNTASKGVTMQDVTKVLDELNLYADKTIYNFAEMTRNIGTFTAAGIGLKESASAIQGIANLAAASGSNSQQASTAMYQLSQALAAGTVKLMDWNSVVNAGMGGEKFQEALKSTAREHGIAVDQMIKNNGSFRESLKEGWITADVLNETLSKFTVEGAKKYSQSMMESGKWTQEQANALIKEAQAMEDAATKVKTFTQLWDTLKESAQSGWSQTWEILVGDFEEAKVTLTSISDVLGGIISASANARNEVLQGWKDLGGRTALLDAFKNAFDGILSVARPIKEAFREIFPPVTAKQLLSLTENIREFTSHLILTDDAAKKLKSAFKGLFSILDIGVSIIKNVVSGFGQILSKLSGLGNGFLNISSSLGDWISKLRDSIKENNIFEKAINGVVKAITTAIEKIKEFKQYLNEKLNLFSFDSLTTVLKGIWNLITGVGKAVVQLASTFGRALGNAFKNGNINSLLDILNGGLFASILLGIKKYISGITEKFDSTVTFIDRIKKILGSVEDTLKSFQDNLKAGTLIKIATAIGILAASLLVISSIDPNRLTSSLGAITVLFGELVGAMALFDKIASKGNSSIKASASMVGMAFSVLILAKALKQIADLEWSGIAKGLVGVLGLMTIVVSAAKIMSTNTGKIKGGATQMVIMAAALKILASVCRDLSTLKWSELGKGVAGIGTILLEFAGFQALMKKIDPKKMLSSATSLILIASAMEIFADVCSKFGQMQWGDLGKAGAAIAGILVLSAGFEVLAGKGSKMLQSSTALVVIGAAMEIFADVCSKFGQMEWGQLGKAGAAITGILALVTGFSLLAEHAESILESSKALLIMAAALAIITPVLTTLGGMTWEEIAKGLVAIAGAFAVIGVAGVLLKPLVPVILGLSKAIALFGVGCLAVGVGVLALSAAFTALATAGAAGATAFVAALTIITVGILQLIPSIVNELTAAVVAICDVIIQSAPAIGEAIKALVLTAIDVLVECIPALADGALQILIGVMQALVEYTPQIVDLFMQFLITLLDSVAARIPELLDSLANLVLTLINGLASHVGEFIEAGVNLFGSIIQGIADALGPIVEKVITPILGVVKDLIIAIAPELQGIAEAISSAITSICEAVTAIIGQIAPIINSITQLIQQLGNTISQILQSIVNIITAAGNTISQVLLSISNVISTVFSGIVNVITAAGSAISQVLESIANVFDSVFNGISNVVTSVGDAIKNVLDGISNVISSVGEAALNAGTGFEKLAGGIKIITELSLADMAASLAAVAVGIGKISDKSDGLDKAGNGMKQIADGTNLSASAFNIMALGITVVLSSLSSIGTVAASSMSTITSSVTSSAVSFTILSAAAATAASNMSISFATIGTSISTSLVGAINNARGQVTASVTSMMTICIGLLRSNVAQFNSVGILLMASFVNGLKSMSSNVLSVVRSTLSSAASSIMGHYSSFYSAGSYVASGLAAGIRAGTPNAVAAAQSMASQVTAAAKTNLNINSPSKVFMSIGKSVGEGFEKGISDKSQTSRVISSTVGLAGKVISSACDTLGINSPSRAFMAIGRYIGEGLAQGIRDSAWQAVYWTEDTAQKVIAVASKTFEDVEKWVEDAKAFDELSLAEELEIWEAVIEKYGEGTEERTKAEKKAYSVYKELQKENYENSKNWIDAEKEYNRLSLQEELEAWQRVQARYVEGTDERKEADKQVYKLKHELIDDSIEALEQEIELQNKLIATLGKTTNEYRNAVKERQHLNDLLLEAQYKNSASYVEDKDFYGRDRGLVEKLGEQWRIMTLRTKKGSDEYKKAAKEIYNIEKKIYEARESYNENVEKIQNEAAEKRIELEEEKADKIKEINEKLQSDIQAADEKYASKLESRTKSLYDAYGLFDEVKEKETVNSATLMKNIQDQVDEFKDWQSVLNSLSARGLNEGLIEELQEMGPSAISEIKALSSMSDSQLQQYATLWSEKHKLAKNKAIDELRDLRISTNSEIKSLRRQAEKDINDAIALCAEKMKELDDNTEEQLRDLKNDFEKTVGIIRTDTESELTEMTQSVHSIMLQVGENIVKGLVNGVKGQEGVLYDTIRNMMNETITIAKEVPDEHSPSKVFMGIGRYMVEGLVNGIDNLKDKAVNTVGTLGHSMINSISSSIARISDVISGDMDVEPTITPVIDLTNVRNGIGMINGAFGANRSMNLGMAIAANNQNGNSYQSELFGKMQDMAEKANGKLTSAIDSLRSDFNDMASKLERMQVVLDSGALVGEIAPDMDSALGGLARMNRRGVR